MMIYLVVIISFMAGFLLSAVIGSNPIREDEEMPLLAKDFINIK